MSWMNIYWVIHYFVEGGQNVKIQSQIMQIQSQITRG